MKWAPPFLSNCLQAAGYVLRNVSCHPCSLTTHFVVYYVSSRVWSCLVRQTPWFLITSTVRFKPMDTQASVALQKLINALAGLEVRSG